MNFKDIIIKETDLNDYNNIMEVETKAFGNDKEAKLTSDLLSDKTANPLISLLAFHQDKAVGHILFTRAYLNKISDDQKLFHILAPLAVVPEYQKKGIGGKLIIEGLKLIKKMGSEMCFVLGHMEYYPKFDFIPDAKKLGYSAPYPIPEEYKNAWMVQTFNPDGFILESGKIICAEKLNEPEHWRE